jgi:RNA polymerase sigma-70 factor (ECF subfamily)
MITGKALMDSDDRIIKGCKKGKQHAFSLLYEKYANVLMLVCLRYSRNKAEAQDVLQEGFIKVFQKIKSFEGRGSFEGWLKRIMVNTAINYYKANKKYHFQEEVDANNNQLAVYDSGDDMVEIDHPVKPEILMRMINELPYGYRMVFNMYVFDGLTHKEIAEDMGVTESTSKSQLSKARKFLRKKIEKEQYKPVKI